MSRAPWAERLANLLAALDQLPPKQDPDAPPLWQQAAGLILAAAFVYLFAVFCLSF